MRLADDVWSIVRRSLPIPCVDLLVVEGARVLMVERRVFPRGWWFPGGRVHLGETREAAARRKLREECGLECDTITDLGTCDLIFDGEVPLEGAPHAITTLMRIRPRGGHVVLDAQSGGFAWRSVDEWLGVVTHPFLRAGLERLR